MEFSSLSYERLPEYIRENENLRQILLQCGGIMKYVVEHIDNPSDDDSPLLFVQYQNHVAENYRRANHYNPSRQHWSVENLRQRALNNENHLWSEYHSFRDLVRNLRKLTDVPHEAATMVEVLTQKYLDYAWNEDLRRRRPDIETDLGIYKYVMQQFERFDWPMRSDGLACRSIDIVLKIHHGHMLTETDYINSFNIGQFHHHFFWPTIIDRMKQGLTELLHDKNAKECRAEAIGMLKRVQWFSQHVFNDEVDDVINDSFTVEDKGWLRSLLDHYDSDRFDEEEFNFFYFGKLFADIGRLWEKQMHRYPDLNLSELEKEVNSIVNTSPSERQITCEDKKMCFKNAVLRVMETKTSCGENLFEKPTQWKAVYRFAVDNTIMNNIDDRKASNDTDKPYATFDKFAHELQLDDNSSIRIPFKKAYIKEMKKKNYARYNTHHPWSQDGLKYSRSLTFFSSLNLVYLELEKEYSKLISQAKKTPN